MNPVIPFPASIKAELAALAAERQFPLAAEILARGGSDELQLADATEAQVIVDVARLAMLEASLKFPWWDEDAPRHDLAHEDGLHDVQMGIFEKTSSYIGQVFTVNTRL